MSNIINPTVGRVLWFIPLPGDPLFSGVPNAQPLAAMLAHVNGDGTVNIGVLDRSGNHHSRHGVPLCQDVDAGALCAERGTPYCVWMPYQKGQAPSSDAVTRQIAEMDRDIKALKEQLTGLTSIIAGSGREGAAEQPQAANSPQPG